MSCCKWCGGPVPLRNTVSEPASLLQILRSEPRRTQQSGAAHRGRGLSDPASATALFARGRGVRHLSTDLLRYSEATQLVAHLDPRGPGTRDRGRCSESSEASLDPEPRTRIDASTIKMLMTAD